MIAVVQRVSTASVSVKDPVHVAEITCGLCVFIGIEVGDEEEQARWMAQKLANLRIFQDSNGNMNLSIKEIQGELLLISQFTLAGDCRSGNRPSFVSAARPDIAEPLVNLVGELLQDNHEIHVCKGVFGAMMEVTIVNDGPVTIVIKRD